MSRALLGGIAEGLGPGPNIRVLYWPGDLMQDLNASVPQFPHLKNEHNDTSFLFLKTVVRMT